MPDLQTWMQCFSVYASVFALKYPQHIPELLAYSRDIMRASGQFKWPFYVIYNIYYCRHMADISQHDWSKINPSIHSVFHWLGMGYLLVFYLCNLGSRLKRLSITPLLFTTCIMLLSNLATSC